MSDKNVHTKESADVVEVAVDAPLVELHRGVDAAEVAFGEARLLLPKDPRRLKVARVRIVLEYFND